MDFAIVGLGVGALAVLIGLGARAGAPIIWPIRHERPLAPRVLANRVALIRFAHAGGLVLALAGTALLVLTVLAIALGVSDRAGAIVVMAAITAGVLAAIGWGVTYARRYHPRPLPAPPRRRPPTATDPAGGGPTPRASRASRTAMPADPAAATGGSAPPPLDDPEAFPDTAPAGAADAAATAGTDAAAVAVAEPETTGAPGGRAGDAASLATGAAPPAAERPASLAPEPDALPTTAVAGLGTRRPD